MEKINDYIVDMMIEEHLKKANEFNEEIRNTEKELYHVACKVDEMKKDLDDKQIELLDKYYSLCCDVESMKSSYIYREAFKDCVNFLKDIGVL